MPPAQGARPPGPDGLLVVDKPGGLTSHDVVGRVRRLYGTRKVGHAGTLDPMATGVLVLGLGRATRLLGHLALGDKTYLATVRLGMRTVTDDAEGEVLDVTDAAHLDPAAVHAAAAELVGEIDQVPSAVSAVKVDGRRAYARVRAGEQVELAARRVTISELTITAVHQPAAPEPGAPAVLDLELTVTCSSGTYVRAIARDLGAALGVGGHLTMLRRTRVGAFDAAGAHALVDLEPLDRAALPLLGLDQAVAAAFPRLDVDAAVALGIAHSGRAPAPDRLVAEPCTGPLGVFGPDGVVALMEQRGDRLRSLVVLAPAAT